MLSFRGDGSEGRKGERMEYTISSMRIGGNDWDGSIPMYSCEENIAIEVDFFKTN